MSERILPLLTRPAFLASGALAPIRELDRVATLAPATGEEGEAIPTGSTGTVVGTWAGGAAYEVEFIQPVDALATIDAALLRVVERSAD